MNQPPTSNEPLKKKKLGLLLSRPPEHPHAHTVTRLSEEALAADVEVYLYLIDEGVKNLHNPGMLNLASSGVKFFVCAYGCQQHKISTDGYGKEVNFCGLVILSNIINGCDRFLAFN
ncbi:MAG: DsrE family protein [Nitrospirales bacterium]|nr:DsrE family protein [Nitrospirales bacterium]